MNYDLDIPDYIDNILIYNNDVNEYINYKFPNLKQVETQDYTQIWFEDNQKNKYSYSYILVSMLESQWLKDKRNKNHIVCPICKNERCQYDWHSDYCYNFNMTGQESRIK
tara:strand:- start:705 stop:1034 length:330 start_codon:yes stop_codon:yes gene_type:complete